MPKFRIFAGLGGGFGGATEIEINNFSNEEEALLYARELSIVEYESFEGSQGLLSWSDCLDSAYGYLCRDDYESEDEYNTACEEYADSYYNEELESWIDYDVEEIIDEDNV